MNKILNGVRVIDISQAYSGPFAAMQLADHGAEVIKVEPTAGEQTRGWRPQRNDHSAYYAYFNRNKKGIALDLKTAEGKEILTKLIASADVVIENFKAGTFARLGFPYERLKEIKPDIIYAQITGFGTNGPMSNRPAYDLVAQAESGIMSLNGYTGNDPVRLGGNPGDGIAGLYLASGIAMALYHRAMTGEGCHIDVAMLDALFSMTESAPLEYEVADNLMGREGNRGSANSPWGEFRAKDGLFVSSCGTTELWRKCAHELELYDMENDPAYDTNNKRVAAVDYIEERVSEAAKKWTVAELEEKMVAAGVPFGRVNNIAEAMELPQLKHRNMLWTVYEPGMESELTTPGNPVKISLEEDGPFKASPLLGENTDELLREIGFDEEGITYLRQKGVVR